MHKWIHNDVGIECYRCGVAVDYDLDPKFEDIAHNLVTLCPGPVLNRAHHYIIMWQPTAGDSGHWYLECHYDAVKCTPHSWPFSNECKGG